MDWQNSELSRMQEELQLSRDRYLDLYDLAPVGYCIVGQNGLIQEANLTAANMLGIMRGELLNKPFSLFCARDYQDFFYLNQRKLIATRAQQSFELQMLRMDGVVFWAALEAIFIPGENNTSLTRVVISDISDRKQSEAALKESEERFRLMFENHKAVMLLVDSITGQIMDANLSAEEFYGYPLSTLLSKSIFELNVLPPDQVKLEMNRAVQSEINYFVFPHRLANGDIRIVEVHSSPLTIREKSALFSIVHDITERKHLEDQLNQLAMTDGLTGIYNRRHFIKEAQNELNRSVHVKRPLALVLFDIDHFKQINDTYGHAAGDQVLLAFTKICQENIREIDVFARYGGDEFVMLLPETSRAEAFEVAERIRMALVNSQMEFESELISLTISSGISDLNDETDSFDKLIERADQALYLAKQAGRNVVMISNEPEPNR